MDISELLKDLEQLNIKDIQVDISNDQMLATVCLRKLTDEAFYTYDEIMSKLSEAGVKMGIDEEEILHMLDQKIYEERVVVAAGKPQEAGADGYYEFFFDTDYRTNSKPSLRADGSVDYFNTKLFEKVNEGAKLAEYHPPTKGVFGYNVCGKLLTPKPGKPKSKLRGKGFTVSEDGNTYYAAFTGKIDYLNYDMNISNIYDVSGDVDLNVGNIEFDGDVNITGSVISGVTIRAMGNIYIGGHVEGAYIYADKDIIFNDGVNCNGKGHIEAKGNISGKYFENAVVNAGGDIKCGYLLNSVVTARGKVIVEGRHGSIFGGDVTGIMGIETVNCGHDSATKTILRVGATKELRKEYADAIIVLKEIIEQIDMYSLAIKKYDAAKKVNPEKFSQETYTKILQSKIIKKAEENKWDERCRHLLELIKDSARADVRIDKIIYPGCRIVFDDKMYVPDCAFSHLRIKRGNDRIVAEGMDEE
ncbi:MAG: FapA family protein [Eubacteriales bacterium]|nr:FapA family protein [Eubacteriales bacterium]